MTTIPAVQDDNHIDDHVDAEISSCMTQQPPKSFFLFAGAGSGKTRSLVNALRSFRDSNGKRLRLHGQQIGVITYTNKACDEIKQRLDFDNLVEVSTIHSFVWSLIDGFHNDIRDWIEINLQMEISELHELQSKGRSGTKASIDRARSIEAKNKRFAALPSIKRFTYNPNGENRGRDSLSHSEVIKIGADWLKGSSIFQKLLISKFPVLLIDESQDTNRLLIESLFKVQADQTAGFCLGLLGDTMQRIYADGKHDLGRNLPPSWAQPVKQMNHRCPRRVVKLINKIRADVDGQVQLARSDKEEGLVRLFVLPNNTANKPNAEREIAQKMAELTGDSSWAGPKANVKTLILEHHMAAARMGFLEMYEPLYKNERLRIGLLDGSLAGVNLFSELVLPLIEAKRRADAFAVAAIVRRNSPLLSKEAFKTENQPQQLVKAREAVEHLWNLFKNGASPTFLDVLKSISQTNLFEIPDSLSLISNRSEAETQAIAAGTATGEPDEGSDDDRITAWESFLRTPFSQISQYVSYVNGKASFDTHQGVKGLEFPRIMVLIDDTEARGFSFDYDKLFGAKEKTKTDLENERGGKDTGIDRTRRLFYVTCSRAEKSLAIVAYSGNPQAIRNFVISRGWFEVAEIL